MQNKIREYHYRREIYYPTIDLLVAFPVHFGFIDAHLSADGPFGIFADRNPNPTETVLGGANILAVDWAGAGKMGLDPMISRYMAAWPCRRSGAPHVDLQGDASPYPGWQNVPKPIIEFWDHAEESYGFTNTAFSMMEPRIRERRVPAEADDALPPRDSRTYSRRSAGSFSTKAWTAELLDPQIDGRPAVEGEELGDRLRLLQRVGAGRGERHRARDPVVAARCE
jgi:hypothetical protein